jgi:Ca2+-binding RTX toxin-like protein
MGGDDTFIASPGQDGINGGEGNDTYTLSEAADRYTVTPEVAGYRVTGPQGSAYLVQVENIAFGDGTIRALD